MSSDNKDAVAVSALMSATIQMALVAGLLRKGVFTVAEVREIFDEALLTLEDQQAAADPQHQAVFEAARELIQKFLQSKSPKPPA
jgi:hypothetical protein